MTSCLRKRSFLFAWVWALMVALVLAPTLTLAEERPEADVWPPELPGFDANGQVTLETEAFLEIPASVREQMEEECAVPFTVAGTPPRVELTLHGDLPHDGRNRTGWSIWGDIGVAADGRVYSSIGDHGDDAAGTANAYIYEWDPQTSTLRQVVDVNAIGEREGGEPTWAKVHARIDQGADGWIYFSGTLNDGQRAGQEQYNWTETLPGGQLLRYNPETEESEVFANLPPARATATSQLDVERNIWWCNLEAGQGDALYAIDLSSGEPIFQTDDGVVSMNRDFAVLADGRVLFNGPNSGELWIADHTEDTIRDTGARLPGPIRGSTRESSDGHVYGVTHRPGHLFRFNTRTEEAEVLGPDILCGDYTTVMVMSPDERFLYYLPGAHGGAREIGTPVMQYHIATGQRKVIGFLKEPFETEHYYVPAGTYGVKISADGRTLYANLNGHPADPYRPEHITANGFGLTSFVAIHIPEEELQDPE